MLPSCAADVYRLRIDAWRIVYIVSDSDRAVDVIAVRRRPPYDYSGLNDLVEGTEP